MQSEHLWASGSNAHIPRCEITHHTKCKPSLFALCNNVLRANVNQEDNLWEPPVQKNEPCCGTGTCIIDGHGRGWCGQIWDGEKLCQPGAMPLTPAMQATAPPAKGQILGFGGLIPFAAWALATWAAPVVHQAETLRALVARLLP